MEIKQLKASLQLAQLRMSADPSEANQQILEKAKADYESALDPEKKTEDPSLVNQVTSGQDPNIPDPHTDEKTKEPKTAKAEA